MPILFILLNNHYTNLTVVHPCERASGSITESYFTRVKKLAFYAFLGFNVAEAVNRNG